MIGNALVFRKEVELSLDSMVLLVKEVNLVLQLGHGLLVDFLLVFHTQLLHVLAARI